MRLIEYRRKRDFDRTPEPTGKVARKAGWSYVVQIHQASHLHYDLRLELDGVLKSWAVPKGPSLDPAVKRLAMHVKDLSVEYGQFEGVIPEGEYGGGTMLLWDRGKWEPAGDPHEDYRSGKLTFRLRGKKLQGGWALVRKGGQTKGNTDSWLLIKERDDHARSTKDGDILEQLPLSVKTGRDLKEIASGRRSARPSVRKAKAVRRVVRLTEKAPRKPNRKAKAHRSRTSRPAPAGVEGAERTRMPARIEVQLATLTRNAPRGNEWIHEIKFDGYRMICRVDGPKVEFISRNQKDWTARLSPLIEEVRQLDLGKAILDGEVVAMQPDGTSNFQSLQNAFSGSGVSSLRYYVFDLLYYEGHSLGGVKLTERKRVLSQLLAASGPSSAVFYSDHVTGDGPAFAQEACRMNLEEIISKRADQPYRQGRGYDWLKIKCIQTDEFVIGGYTDPENSRAGFGALLLGYYSPDGQLVYSGKVGTGFSEKTLQSLSQRLSGLEQAESPFVDMTRKVGPARRAHWVQPRLVAQIAYSNRTEEGFLRHPSFQGIRKDKAAREVTLPVPVPVVEAVKRGRQLTVAGHAKRKKR